MDSSYSHLGSCPSRKPPLLRCSRASRAHCLQGGRPLSNARQKEKAISSKRRAGRIRIQQAKSAIESESEVERHAAEHSGVNTNSAFPFLFWPPSPPSAVKIEKKNLVGGLLTYGWTGLDGGGTVAGVAAAILLPEVPGQVDFLSGDGLSLGTRKGRLPGPKSARRRVWRGARDGGTFEKSHPFR